MHKYRFLRKGEKQTSRGNAMIKEMRIWIGLLLRTSTAIHLISKTLLFYVMHA